MHKEFVEVVVKYTKEGQILPQEIHWKDGRRFEVDKILDARQAPSLKAGGQGMRYTCRIMGKEVYIWLEEDRWFVEGK